MLSNLVKKPAKLEMFTDIFTLLLMFMLLYSVSDLLDYINPNHDAKGKDAAAGRRRSCIMKVG